MADPRMAETQARDEAELASMRRVTWAGLGLNLALSAVKLVGGVVAHSQAVVADGVHSLTDISTDLGVLVGMKHWRRPADDGHPHGHRRLELVVTLGIGAVLLLVGAGLLWRAISALGTQARRPGWLALAVAVVAVISKEVIYRWSVAVGRRLKCMPLVANAWHHRSDALSSLPVVVAVAGSLAGPEWIVLDRLGAMLVSVFIFHAALKLTWEPLTKLTDIAASEEMQQDIRSCALATPGVGSIHELRTRYLGGSSLAVDLHIQVEGDMSVRRGHEVAEQVENRLLEEIDEVVDVVVHLEPLEDDGPERR